MSQEQNSIPNSFGKSVADFIDDKILKEYVKSLKGSYDRCKERT